MMLTGVINTLRNGFGFIRPDSGESNYFFHASTLLGIFGELRCGQAVTFQVVASDRGGYKAHRVELLIHVVEALQECTAGLVEYLVQHPDSLRDLHPGTFENLVAEIFREEGFATERISDWNKPDGGVDLIAVRHLSPGLDIRIAIQCKRWAQPRKLGAEPLRSLEGVLDRFQAHAGVVATTGLFSKKAEKERVSHFWRISWRDYYDILASLRRLRLTN
jgi:cold shock CspA family protein